MVRLEPELVVDVVNCVPKEKLQAVCSAPTEALVAVLSTVDMNRFRLTLIPLLQEPLEFIRGKVVPLISSMEHPERLGHMMNHAELRVLLWIVRGVQISKLKELMRVLEPTDLESGTISSWP